MSLSGHVYIAQFADGLIKIGFSKAPEFRISQVRKTSGRALVESWVGSKLCDGMALEQQVLAALAEYRVQGEWFCCSMKRAVAQAELLQASHTPWSEAWEKDMKEAAQRREDGMIEMLNSHRVSEISEGCIELLANALQIADLRDAAYGLVAEEHDFRSISTDAAMVALLTDERVKKINHIGIMAAAIVGDRVRRAVLDDREAAAKLIACISEIAKERHARLDPLDMAVLDSL